MWYKNKNKKYKINRKEITKMEKYIGKQNVDIFFGFDIAKDFHYLSILIKDNKEEIIFDIWEIQNNIQWFNELWNIIDTLIQKIKNQKNIYIWLEVTWSYYFSLLKFLKEKKLKNIYVINGSKIKNFNLSINNSQVKNDKQDSIIICKYISTNKDKLETNENIDNNDIKKSNFLEMSNLKFLYRQLRKEKQEKRKIMSKIKELTNRVFPEIYDVFISAKYNPWELEYYIKSNFTKNEIVQMDKKEFYTKVIKDSQINDSLQKNRQKIYKLHDLVKNSIWIEDSSWHYRFQMKILVDKYYQTKINISKIETFILKELENKNIYIPQILWASKISLWVFYAELWDSIYTKNHKQIAGFIWWYPSENSSWWKILSKPRLEKRWNKLLREQIYLLVYNLCSKIPEVNELKKRIMNQKNIKAIEAIIIIWSIFIRIISSLYKTWQNFDINTFRSNYLE